VCVCVCERKSSCLGVLNTRFWR